MKVLLICKSLNTELGGIQTHTRFLATYLAKQGAEVHILTGRGWQDEPTNRLKDVKVISLKHLPGYRLKGLRALADDLFFNLKACQWLLRHASEYDLLHVQGRSGLLYALWPWRAKPCIVTFHGLTREEFRNSRRFGKVSPDQALHQWLFHRLERMAYQKAEGVITVSEFMRQHLQQHLRVHRWEVGVISNGVDLKRFQQVTSHPLTVTYLGRLDPNKGLKSLPILLSHLPQPLRLRIIGGGRMGPWLRQEIDRLGLSHRVDWTGPLPNDQVMPLLADSLALVVPSYYEPQGLVVLEAFERGVPVIASAVGGLKELVKHIQNGWLVKSGYAESMAQRLVELYQNPSLRQRLAQNARREVEMRYQWRQIAAETQEFYQAVIK